jgi:uncharacterized membrane-anchored protein
MRHQSAPFGERVNRVPSVTVEFWLIKLLAVTVGETAADYLTVNLGLGLTATSVIMSVGLGAAMMLQCVQKRYVPGVYWTAVIMISIVGTLVSDNLSEDFSVPLEVSTAIFALALAVTFLVWWRTERDLSILAIHSDRREAYYWLAVLFSFALGTAAGDFAAEALELGYLAGGFLFAVLIGAVALSYHALKVNALLAFWLAYILTRPLGASIGDFLSQPINRGGLGLGSTSTSLLFFGAIGVIVVYMGLTYSPTPNVEHRARPRL